MRRALRPLVALALGALIATGCTSTPERTTTDAGGAGSGSGSGATTDRDAAVAFAECMRANGVSGFPDPDASGELTLDAVANGSGLDTSSPAFAQAMDACRDLAPSGFTGHARSASEQEVALQFARCIREHGVQDFPDPTPDGPLVDTNRIPSLAASDDLSVLNAAMETCGDVAADLLTGP